MPINKNNSVAIYEQCQKSIQELNQLLLNLKSELDEDDFVKVRLSIAGAMGELVNTCEEHVYNQFPEMRPYKLG
ncbi:MAG TPA: hypothetical protein VL995_22120 [Cellvibrio sp.]|nr:hypothetical protein [Cellvibrio sp.]